MAVRGRKPPQVLSAPVPGFPSARMSVAHMHAHHVQYTEEIGREICARLADGESLNKICKSPGLPTERAVRAWAEQESHPFAEPYAKAREAGYLKLADELLDIADDGRNDWMTRETERGETTVANAEHIQRSRLRIDTRKWMLSKMLPKVFGDKVTTEHTGKDGAPIEQVLKIERVIVDPKPTETK